MTQTRRKAGIGLAMLAAGALFLAPQARAGAGEDILGGIEAIGRLESGDSDRPLENRQRIRAGAEAVGIVRDIYSQQEDRESQERSAEAIADGLRDAARINQNRKVRERDLLDEYGKNKLNGENLGDYAVRVGLAVRSEEEWLFVRDEGKPGYAIKRDEYENRFRRTIGPSSRILYDDQGMIATNSQINWVDGNGKPTMATIKSREGAVYTLSDGWQVFLPKAPAKEDKTGKKYYGPGTVIIYNEKGELAPGSFFKYVDIKGEHIIDLYIK